MRDAFASNFARRGDVGTASCVDHRGRPVVDVWGGLAWHPVVAAIAAQAPLWEPGNQMQLGMTGDPRAARLARAVDASL